MSFDSKTNAQKRAKQRIVCSYKHNSCPRIELIARDRQRRFRDRKETYTKQLEKKISELEELSANLQAQLSRLSKMVVPEGNGVGKDLLLQCP